ncbi:hypothetical protein HR51_40665 [Burkholderia cepacia]|nr:hypothetical protein HR51_40665 [Burkholderia cepacia]
MLVRIQGQQQSLVWDANFMCRAMTESHFENRFLNSCSTIIEFSLSESIRYFQEKHGGQSNSQTISRRVFELNMTGIRRKPDTALPCLAP